MGAGSSTSLAHRTEKRRPRTLDDAPDRRPAANAGLARAPVDLGVELELARGAVCVAEIAQGRAAELDGARQRRSHRIREPRGARAADAIAARARIDARFEQRFACVDVAGADDDLAAEERRLDGDAATSQRGVEMRAVEAIVEGLEAEAGEQRRRRRGVGRRRPDDGAEAARIGEAQRAARRDEVEVVVRAGLGRSWRRTKAIRTCRGASAGRRDRARPRGTCRAGSPRRHVAPRSSRGSRRAASAAACRRAPRSRERPGSARQS
jgi:hypothetical protein